MPCEKQQWQKHGVLLVCYLTSPQIIHMRVVDRNVHEKDQKLSHFFTLIQSLQHPYSNSVCTTGSYYCLHMIIPCLQYILQVLGHMKNLNTEVMLDLHTARQTFSLSDSFYYSLHTLDLPELWKLAVATQMNITSSASNSRPQHLLLYALKHGSLQISALLVKDLCSEMSCESHVCCGHGKCLQLYN